MKAWEENIRKVVPYIPGEQPQVKDIIKLNTNENPYPPSPGVKKAHEEMEVSRFALYPDPAAKELVTALESYHGLDAGQVFVGVGSDDVLALAFLTFLIPISRFCFRMLHIRFILFGLMFTGFRTSVQS